jgi:hypothetical protein
VKDRARPFSKKHRRYWLPVTGGMILIGLVNLAIGLYLYSGRPRDAPRRPTFDANPFVDAAPHDAGAGVTR